MQEYYVYLMASINRTIYVGITSNLEDRVCQHKSGTYEGFTKDYNVDRLVWFETFTEIEQAIDAEKKIKKWRRSKKIDLIEKDNPDWEDLARGWGDQ